MEFGKIEKVILIYFGLKKTKSSRLVKRTHITKEIAKILGREDDDVFPVVLNNSLRRLIVDKKLLYRRYSKVGINNKGLEVASNLFDEVKKRSGDAITSWDEILENL